ncbi:myrosinase 1-like [Onthophagus taurus]|uniref:myrosinase 1-like n=1 Tax=Onthophagus taurus TaxID=166361 RepID=UPI0039BDF698
MRLILYITTLLCACSCYAQEYAFPPNFQFGVATAAYQVEGGWNSSGKGENIWDRLTHTRSELITDGSNGDIACDTYNKAIEDVQLLKSLGVDFYRFSFSWSRILPTGTANKINPDGIRYYNEMIDELLANGIKPFATMYHWDLPQPLQELGGWPNSVIADLFADYANVLYENFGDRIKDWITFNEVGVFCGGGYESASMAPAYNGAGFGVYLCGHTVLRAHGKAYRLYESKYKASQGGRVGITIDSGWYEPASESPVDIEAAETAIQMGFGWFAHPIFSTDGDYPPVMKQRIAQKSAEEGFSRSRLPEFTSEEIAEIRGSSDFFGLNHYTTNRCTIIPDGWGTPPSQWTDAGALCSQDADWEPSASSWLKVVPWGFRKLLVWIKNEYNNPEVVVTENGFSDRGELRDCRRINYYNSYLEQLLKAIHEDGCNVSGYTAWSFMDNFEWMRGFTERFGLYYVDFNDPNRPRTPKMSYYVYKNILATKRVDWKYSPDSFDECEF